MSTLNRALKSLQMIKFARRTNFYWYSPLDPEADAYDAVKQQILTTRDKITHNYYPNVDTNKATAALDKALEANETLAADRRNQVSMSKPVRIGALIGGGLGGVAGAGLGYSGSNALSYMLGLKRKGVLNRIGDIGLRTIGTLGGAAIGGTVGMLPGVTIGANYYVNNENTPAFDNGHGILTKLNDDLNAASKKKKPNLIDINAADNARENARKRKQGTK